MKSFSIRLLFTMAALLTSLSACDPYQQDDYREQYVVQAFMVVDQPMPMIRLTTTSPINATYNTNAVAVSGAQPEIRKLDAQGKVLQTIPYRMKSAGWYEALNPQIKVDPLSTYELSIRTANAPEITARTFTPDRLRVLNLNNTSIKYQSTEQFEVIVSYSAYPGRQNYYVFTVETLDPDKAELTPFYADAIGEDERETVFKNQSNIVFEGNYGLDPSRTALTLKLPWLGFAFYGPNRVSTHVLDDAMYDFIRTKDVQLGGSTLSPGEINNVLTNVKNGLGIFGSYASASVDINILK